jgi:hypothetical protein
VKICFIDGKSGITLLPDAISHRLFRKVTIMSKAKSAVVVEQSYKSLSDFGYNVAKRADALRADGAWALDNIVGFPEDISPESRVELYEGFRQRASELPKYSEVVYGIVDNNVIPLSQLSGDAPKEQFKVNVAIAFSYNQQQIGAMKSEDPAKYRVIYELRDRVNKYCSNRLNDLKTAAKKVLRERDPDSHTRAATLSFGEYVLKTLDTLKVRCKSAETRGNDPTANSKALDAAIIAFKVKLDSVKQ